MNIVKLIVDFAVKDLKSDQIGAILQEVTKSTQYDLKSALVRQKWEKEWETYLNECSTHSKEWKILTRIVGQTI